MSDDGLRELERRWRATGDLRDEARSSTVSSPTSTRPSSELTLAARCGHAAAALVVEVPHEADLWAWRKGWS